MANHNQHTRTGNSSWQLGHPEAVATDAIGCGTILGSIRGRRSSRRRPSGPAQWQLCEA